MQNNQNLKEVETNTSVSTKKSQTLTDKVLTSVTQMTKEQGLVLPKNYNVSNALKAAYLKLADSDLLNTDQTALAQALLNMCVQGLNPAKNQCYFINYGGKVNLMRSYFGDRAVCITSGLVTDIQAYIIYEGDKVEMNYVDGYLTINHETSWENQNNDIKGAYAMAILKDGKKLYDVMTIERIKKSWSMSKSSNSKLQNNYSDDACKRTVIRHLVKNIFNQSTDDNLVADSYCQTTSDEYENKDYIDAKETYDKVEAKKEETMGSVKVDVETGEVVAYPPKDDDEPQVGTPTEAPEQDPFDVKI